MVLRSLRVHSNSSRGGLFGFSASESNRSGELAQILSSLTMSTTRFWKCRSYSFCSIRNLEEKARRICLEDIFIAKFPESTFRFTVCLFLQVSFVSFCNFERTRRAVSGSKWLRFCLVGEKIAWSTLKYKQCTCVFFFLPQWARILWSWKIGFVWTVPRGTECSSLMRPFHVVVSCFPRFLCGHKHKLPSVWHLQKFSFAPFHFFFILVFFWTKNQAETLVGTAIGSPVSLGCQSQDVFHCNLSQSDDSIR